MIAVVCGDATITRWPPKTPGALGWDGQPYMEARFPDGTVAPSAPTYGADQVRLAAACGYGTDTAAVRAFWAEHDPLHQWTMVACGEPHSTVLWAAAHGITLPKGIIPAEEALVMTLQALLHGGEAEPGLILRLRDRTGMEIDQLVAAARSWLASFGEE